MKRGIARNHEIFRSTSKLNHAIQSTSSLDLMYSKQLKWTLTTTLCKRKIILSSSLSLISIWKTPGTTSLLRERGQEFKPITDFILWITAKRVANIRLPIIHLACMPNDQPHPVFETHTYLPYYMYLWCDHVRWWSCAVNG